MDAVNRRSPLFSLQGCSPAKTLQIDCLHTLHLGVIASFIKHTWWQSLETNLWNVPVANQASVIDLGIKRLFNDLCAWYETHGIPHNMRLQHLTSKMLGTHDAKLLKTKGADNAMLLRFTVDLISK